jgi:hypothetical protein
MIKLKLLDRHQNQNLRPDRPQIRNIPDRALALATQNPLSPDKDMAILKGKNPLFSGQTYGGASGGLIYLYTRMYKAPWKAVKKTFPAF